MDLRQLRYFIVCAEAQNLTEGAVRLGLSQPALSRQIRQLEIDLGVVLLDRLPRGVRVTEAGARLLEEGKRLLRQAEIVREKTIKSVSGKRGRVTIGFAGIASRHQTAADLMRRFRREYPDIDLQIVPMGFFDQLDAMRVGMIDAAFRFSEPDPGREFERRTLMHDNILLATPKGYFATCTDSLTIADLRLADFILIKRDYFPYYSDRLMAACVERDFYPHVVQEVGDDFTLLSLISVGMGVGFVYASMNRWAPEIIEFHAVTDLTLGFDLDLMWKRDNVNPCFQEFLAFVHHSPAT